MAINRSGKRRGATCAYLETLALRHRGLPRAAQEHRRRAPPHPRHEHGELDSRPVHEARAGGRPVDAVLARRDARPARPLRPRLRGALPGVRAHGRARASIRLFRQRARRRSVAQDADDALRDRASVDHVQGSLQRPLAAGSRRRRAQLEPVHRDHAQHLAPTRPRCATSARSTWRATSSTGRLDASGARATRSRWRCGCSTTSSTSTSTRRRRRSTSNLRHRPIGLGIMGSRTRSSCSTCRSTRRTRSTSPTAAMELISYHAILASSRAGDGARRVRVVRRLEVGPRHLPARHPRPARAERGVPIDVDRDAAAGLDAGARARHGARDAQLEHDGDRADGDDRQHRRLLSLHRADLQEHLRQGQHQRRVHHRQRATWSTISRRSACGPRTCSSS